MMKTITNLLSRSIETIVLLFKFVMGRASKKNTEEHKISLIEENSDQHTTRIRRPRALGGKLRRNLARTAPLLPCARVTFPQIIRTRFKRF